MSAAPATVSSPAQRWICASVASSCSPQIGISFMILNIVAPHLAQRLACSVDQIFQPATQISAAQRRGILQPAGGGVIVQQIEPQEQLFHSLGAIVAANALRAGQLKYAHGSTS